MNTIKIFYMALAKENIPIYGVVRDQISLVTYLLIATKNISGVHNQRERCGEGNSQDTP